LRLASLPSWLYASQTFCPFILSLFKVDMDDCSHINLKGTTGHPIKPAKAA